jgi:hypothetical protein
MARSLPPLRRIPLATGTQPGAITPQAWNSMVSYCEDLSRRVDSLTPQSSPDIAVKHTPNGFTAHLKRRSVGGSGGGGGTVEGAFYTIYTVSSEDATNGDIMLTGGQVAVGTGNPVIAPIVLFDQSAADGAGAWTGTPGQILQLEITGTGSEVDDVLLPTFDADDPLSAPAAAASLDANVLPEIGALTGTCFVSLGVFTAAGFTPSNVGNLAVSFCYGGFTVSRF